jgi:hypothetical protein
MARLAVHHNEIRMTEGHVGVPYGMPTAYSAENRFWANRYFLSDPNAKAWLWRDGPKSWAEWKAAGQDPESALEPLAVG